MAEPKRGDRVHIEAEFDEFWSDYVVVLTPDAGNPRAFFLRSALRPASPPAVVGSPVPSDAVVEAVARALYNATHTEAYRDHYPLRADYRYADAYGEQARAAIAAYEAHRGSPVGDEERALRDAALLANPKVMEAIRQGEADLAAGRSTTYTRDEFTIRFSTEPQKAAARVIAAASGADSFDALNEAGQAHWLRTAADAIIAYEDTPTARETADTGERG